MNPILIDCDDVLSDFLDGALVPLARRHGRDIDINSLSPGWSLPLAFRWPEIDEVVTKAVCFEDLCLRMPELPGAIAWLRELESTFGPERVFVCTNPWNARWAAQRYEWLAARGVPKQRVIMASAKEHVTGLLVDDAAHHIEARKPGTGFLFHSPQNKLVRDRYPNGGRVEALAWLKERA